jgi:hypothetical protein
MLMIKIRLALIMMFLLTLLTVTVVAQKSKAPVKAPAPDYFPLRVGDSWKYRNTSGESEFTLKVVSAEKQADGTMLYLIEKLAGAKIQLWYSKTSEWVLQHRESYPEHEGLEIKYAPAKQYLRNPLVAGAKWNWAGKSVTQNDLNESHQVIGPEMVEVPAGKFMAMKIVSQISEASPKTVTTWYAKGVGMVKYVTDAGQIHYGYELVDYSFKKASPK